MSEIGRRRSHHHKPTNLGRKKANYPSGIISRAILLICVLAGLTACSPAVYHVSLKYEPSGQFLKLEKSVPDFSITVATFNDIRKIDDKLVLGRVTTMEGDRIPILPRYKKVPEAVTTSVREYLFKSGYKVSNDMPGWNLKEDTIGKNWGRIVIGGNIDELEIVCEKSFPMKTYQAKAKLSFVFANVPDKRIFYRASVENSNSLKDVSFSEELLEKEINAVLSDALEKMFNDPKMKKTIEEGAKIKK
ncbi:MAG: hypothetical protein ACXU9F_08850 [Syntrophales bacterium]